MVLYAQRPSVLSGWPGHIATANDMQVKMLDRLTGAAPSIDNNAKAILGNAKIIGHARADAQEIAKQRLIIARSIIKRIHMFARDNQNVFRRLRINIMESHAPFILINNIGRLIASANSAKQTIIRHIIPLYFSSTISKEHALSNKEHLLTIVAASGFQGNL
jgi:hypothetical protein